MPISLPSMTVSVLLAISRWRSTSFWRTSGSVLITDAAWDISSVRMNSFTSSPSSTTCCSPLILINVTVVSVSIGATASASPGSIPFRTAFRPSARYIAPVSTYVRCIISAIRFAMVLLPAPAGPSMAILMMDIIPSSCLYQTIGTCPLCFGNRSTRRCAR